MGEIGLSGEMRSVTQIERRLSEAAKLGFSKAVCPPLQTPIHIEGMQITQVKSVFDAIEAALGPAPRRTTKANDE